MSLKERERVYLTAELVQRNFIELRKEDPDLDLEKLLEVLAEKGYKISLITDEPTSKEDDTQSSNKAAKQK